MTAPQTDITPTQVSDLPDEYVGDLNSLADICAFQAKRKGWDEYPPRTVGDDIALMHSELSEALEEYRNGHSVDEVYGPVDGKPEGVPIELADVLIRIFHFCGKYGIDIQSAVRTKLKFNETRPHRHGGKVI